MAGDFDFTDDFNNQYPAGPLNPYNGSHNFQPVQPNHQLYPGQVAPQQLPPFTQQQPQLRTAGEPRSEKRKADDMSPPSNASTLSMEEQSRHAAEEDKRRRNTAASARFRVKKKQREQALEKSAKDMTEKVTSLESKVSQLETENKWLKNLLVDKSGGGEDINGLWKDFINHRQQIKDKADR